MMYAASPPSTLAILEMHIDQDSNARKDARGASLLPPKLEDTQED